MKNYIIGTAGHVDHGKTMLIKALTGIDTDLLLAAMHERVAKTLSSVGIENGDTPVR